MVDLNYPYMKLAKLRVDTWSKYFLLLAAALTALQGGVIFWALVKLPPQVPLFYSLPWGEDRLVTPNWLVLLPAVSLGIIIVNLLGSFFLKEVVLTRVLSSTAFLVALLAFITLSKIVLLGLP